MGLLACDHQETCRATRRCGLGRCLGRDSVARSQGPLVWQDWAEFAKAMKKADRYHVEVY